MKATDTDTIEAILDEADLSKAAFRRLSGISDHYMNVLFWDEEQHLPVDVCMRVTMTLKRLCQCPGIEHEPPSIVTLFPRQVAQFEIGRFLETGEVSGDLAQILQTFSSDRTKLREMIR